jgi:Zn-dependent protease with chaperone function
MISLRNFVLILLVLACYHVLPTEPTVTMQRSLLSLVAMVLGFAVFIKTAALQAVVRSGNSIVSRGGTAKQRFEGYRHKIETAWALALPLCLWISGWVSWVKHYQSVGLPESLGLFSCFIPALLLVLFAELVAAQMDQMCQVGDQVHWFSHWRLRIRLGEMAGLLTCLVPVLLMASLGDIGNVIDRHLQVESAWTRILPAAILTSGFVMMFPKLLASWSSSQDLPGPLQSRVDEILRSVRVSGVQARLIPSQNRWSGAAIVGWLPGFRQLWLGDSLVENLSQRQLDMVIMHELAHVTRMHFLWRMTPVVLGLTAGTAAWIVADQLEWTSGLAVQFLTTAVTSSTLLCGLSWMAHRCELDADRTACDLAIQALPWSQTHSPALALGAALDCLTEHSGHSKSTWLHPSLDQRIEQLAVWHARQCQPIGSQRSVDA